MIVIAFEFLLLLWKGVGEEAGDLLMGEEAGHLRMEEEIRDLWFLQKSGEWFLLEGEEVGHFLSQRIGGSGSHWRWGTSGSQRGQGGGSCWRRRRGTCWGTCWRR